jgi:hypothetical protein
MFYFAEEVVVSRVGVDFMTIISAVAIVIPTGNIYFQFLSPLVSIFRRAKA